MKTKVTSKVLLLRSKANSVIDIASSSGLHSKANAINRKIQEWKVLIFLIYTIFQYKTLKTVRFRLKLRRRHALEQPWSCLSSGRVTIDVENCLRNLIINTIVTVKQIIFNYQTRLKLCKKY